LIGLMRNLSSLLVPLRQRVFRRIWIASLLSNFGLLIQGVGSAWVMTQLTSAPAMVALVQSALMLPTMFFSLAAGALADMYDRRKVALCALGLALTGASMLVVMSGLHLLSPVALLPLMARQSLHGDARIYGLMLGSFGMGSVLGALGVSAGRNRPSAESCVRINTLVLAAAVLVIALSRWRILSAVALMVAGTSWLSLANLFNVSVQMLAPRWVAARTLATYQAAISGGVAVGGWIWGLLAGMWSVSSAMFCAGVVIGLSPLLGRWQPMPVIEHASRVRQAENRTIAAG
jgi:MFS family permease